MDKRFLIITGGNLNLEWATEWIETQHFDYIIAADKGLVYADRLNCKIDYILGDYDSVDNHLLQQYRNLNIEITTFPCEKDYTDTHLAIETAIQKGAKEIFIIGATGSRLDHTLSNIQNMKTALDENIGCYIINEFNKIYLVNKKVKILKSAQYGNYISLIPLTQKVTGITLKGFYYPLDNYDMVQGKSVGVSNEIVDESCTIAFKEGILIVFETRD